MPPSNNTNNNFPNRTPAMQILGPTANIQNNFVQGSYTFIFQNSTGKLNAITLVVNPEEFEQVETSTTNVILTAGDVFSDSFGPGLSTIRISGTFGQRPIVNGQQGSGQLELLKLRNLFRQYLDELNPITTGVPSRNIGAKLLFFNYKDNEFYEIEPVGNYLTLKRSKAAPFLYRYDINFVAVRRVGNNYVESLLYFTDSTSQLNSFLQDTDNLTQEITDNLTTFTSYLTLIGSNSAASAFTNTVFSPLNQLESAVSTYLSAGSQVINFPQNLLGSIKSGCFNLQQGIFKEMFDLDSSSNLYIPSINFNPEFSNILTNTILNSGGYELYGNQFNNQFTTSDFINQTTPSPDPSINYVTLSQVQNVTYYTIQYGDTLEGIALNLLGSTDYWTLLASFNDLQYPYISTSFLEGTLAPGQNLSIPSLSSNPSSPSSNTSNNIVLTGFQAPPSINSSFGEDLFLDANGDFDISPTGDLDTISGIDNLKQALRLKLGIYKGELLVHPDFGIMNLLGLRTTTALAAMAQNQLESTLLSDPRILNVPLAQVNINNDIASFTASVTPNFGAPPVTMSGSFSFSGAA